MRRKTTRYIVTILLSLIVALSIGGKVTYADAIDDVNPVKELYDEWSGKKKLDDMIEETKETNPEYKEQKKKEETKKAKNQAYAIALFKDSKKNQKLMYYDAQTGTKADTVESKIKDKTHNKEEAQKYASFLYSLDAWNLYNVSSTQQDAITYWVIAIIKGAYGTVLLGCFYLLSGLETLKDVFASLMDYLNIFKYITGENGQIPENSPWHFLTPVVSIYHKLTTFAKVLLAIFMAWIAFRLATGGGKASMRGNYAKNGGLKILYAVVAMALAATFASISITVGTDMLRDSKGASTSAIEKIPRGTIIDTHQYIDNSLSDISGKKGAEGTNNGYVLNHDKGFPTSADEVHTKIPTKKLVEYMNTNDDEKKAESLSGKDLLYNWSYSVNLNANDISTMYNLSQKVSQDNNMNYLAFKLAPETDGVKLTGGKEFFGTELKDAQVASGSMAGNTGMGVLLSSIKMGAIILTVTAVIVMLYFAIAIGFINAIKDFFINVSFSQMGMYQAFFGIFVTATMFLLGIQLTLFLVQIFPDLVLSIDDWFTDQLNKDDKFDGTVKQTLQTAVTVLVLWGSTVLVWKVRKGVMKLVSEWFSRILDGMNPEGSLAGGSRQDKRALENALNSNLVGQDLAEDVSNNPYGAARNGIATGVNGAKKGLQSLKAMQSKDKKEEQSVMDLMEGSEENASGVKNEKSAEFSGAASNSQDDSNDDANTNELQQDINEGIQNLEDTSEEGVARNLDEQDKSIANATNEFEKLNASQQELQNAKDNLENLKESGAPKEEIMVAEQRVADAEKAYNSQLGKSQEASRILSRSGAGIEDMGASKAQAMRDYHDASNEIESAEQKVSDLTSQREEMEAFGASEAQIAQVDKQINEAKDELTVGKQKQQLAQKAYESNVINPTAEKEARTSLVEAQEGHVKAERALEQATKNGNLNTEEYETLKKAATSLGSEVHTMKQQIDEQVETGVVKQNAINHMKQNGGKAFTEADFNTQKNELQNANQQVESIQRRYDEAISNPNNNSQRMEILQNELSNAKAKQANIETATQAMSSGKNVGEAIKSQEQVVHQAYETKVNAEKVLSQLEAQEKTGVMTDRSKMQNAVSQVQQAQVAYGNAGRVMAGLQAVRNVGHTEVPEVKLQELQDNTQQDLSNLYQKQQEVSGVQNTISKLENGGHADIRETHAISKVQKQARRKASEKVKDVSNRYNDLQQKIEKLKRLEKNGVHVQTQVSRYQSSLRQTKVELDNAKQQEEFISSQGFSINSIGNTMKNNYTQSKDKVKEMSELVSERQGKHQNILKTGGLSKDQLEKYKQQLSDEKEKAQSDMEQFSKDRASKVASIKKELNV